MVQIFDESQTQWNYATTNDQLDWKHKNSITWFQEKHIALTNLRQSSVLFTLLSGLRKRICDVCVCVS